MHLGVKLQDAGTSKTSCKAAWKKDVIFCCSINTQRSMLVSDAAIGSWLCALLNLISLLK
jgi:hypothetical protein